MDWRSVRFDWNRARAFLVTVEEGSLSAAARALGMAQPTLGRQVAALEEELGVVLFERVGRGLRPTPSGLELIEHVRAMGDAATRVSLAASGQSQSVEGTVCITATEIASGFVLPPIIAGLRRDFPGIAIELVATNSLRDLRRREADIAIRSVRPTDPDLVARLVGEGVAEFFATPAYLDSLGPIRGPDDLKDADFIGFEDNEEFLRAIAALGLPLTARNFRVRTANHLVQWALIRQGIGIGGMLSEIGEADPEMRRAAPWLEPFRFPLWLVAHRELNTSRRVRLVFDRLATELKAHLSDAARVVAARR